MKKIFLVLALALLVLAGPGLSQDDEYHFIVWCYRDGMLMWYVSVGAKYDEKAASWILTDAARLAEDRIVRLLSVAVPKERVVSVEHLIGVHAEDLH